MWQGATLTQVPASGFCTITDKKLKSIRDPVVQMEKVGGCNFENYKEVSKLEAFIRRCRERRVLHEAPWREAFHKLAHARPKSAIRIYACRPLGKMSPDLISSDYDHLALAFVKVGNVYDAIRVHENMRSQGMHTSEVFRRSLIRLCLKRGFMRDVIALVDQHISNNPSPNPTPHTNPNPDPNLPSPESTPVFGLTAEGNSEPGSTIDRFIACSLVRALGTLGHFDQIEHFVKQHEPVKELIGETVGGLITKIAVDDDIDRAVRILARMEALGVEVRHREYSHILACYMRARRYDEAQQWVDMLLGLTHTYTPDENSPLHAFSCVGEDVRHRVRAKLEKDSHIFSLVLGLSSSRSPEPLLNLLEMAKATHQISLGVLLGPKYEEHRTPVDSLSCVAMARELGRLELFENISELLSLMESLSINGGAAMLLSLGSYLFHVRATSYTLRNLRDRNIIRFDHPTARTVVLGKLDWVTSQNVIHSVMYDVIHSHDTTEGDLGNPKGLWFSVHTAFNTFRLRQLRDWVLRTYGITLEDVPDKPNILHLTHTHIQTLKQTMASQPLRTANYPDDKVQLEDAEVDDVDLDDDPAMDSPEYSSEISEEATSHVL